jgi:hypothetical protein
VAHSPDCLIELAFNFDAVHGRLGKPREDSLDLAIVVHRRPHDLDLEREEGANVCF